MDPELGAATLRALALVERTRADDRAGSPALAGLHLQRLLGRASLERLGERAARAAVRWSAAGVALAARPWPSCSSSRSASSRGSTSSPRQHGEAPLPLAWVDDVEHGARRRPSTCTSGRRTCAPSAAPPQPRGTTLTVRGRPLRARARRRAHGRQTDVPFVDDGAGARRRALDGRREHHARRRRRVRRRPARRRAHPSARRAGGRLHPRSWRRASSSRARRAPCACSTSRASPSTTRPRDDHGLREVDLVLRAGAREERRVLSHPAADVHRRSRRLRGAGARPVLQEGVHARRGHRRGARQRRGLRARSGGRARPSW